MVKLISQNVAIDQTKAPLLIAITLSRKIRHWIVMKSTFHDTFHEFHFS